MNTSQPGATAAAAETRVALAALDAALAELGARPLRDFVPELDGSPASTASPVQFGEPFMPSPAVSTTALPVVPSLSASARASPAAAARTPPLPAVSAFASAAVLAAGGTPPGRSSVSMLNEYAQKRRVAQPVYSATSKQLSPGPNGLFHYAACEVAGQRFEGREGLLRKQNAKEAAAHLALQHLTKL